MNELNKRLIEIADYYGVARPADFAKRTGFSHQTASNYLKGERIPNAEALCVIKRSFDISADWLLTGEGEMMLHEQQQQAGAEPVIIYKSDPKDIEIIASKNAIIKRDAQLIENLELRIKDLESKLLSLTPGLDSARSVDTTPGIDMQHTHK